MSMGQIFINLQMSRASLHKYISLSLSHSLLIGEPSHRRLLCPASVYHLLPGNFQLPIYLILTCVSPLYIFLQKFS